MGGKSLTLVGSTKNGSMDIFSFYKFCYQVENKNEGKGYKGKHGIKNFFKVGEITVLLKC